LLDRLIPEARRTIWQRSQDPPGNLRGQPGRIDSLAGDLWLADRLVPTRTTAWNASQNACICSARLAMRRPLGPGDPRACVAPMPLIRPVN
jgi:hypothetical protein